MCTRATTFSIILHLQLSKVIRRVIGLFMETLTQKSIYTLFAQRHSGSSSWRLRCNPVFVILPIRCWGLLLITVHISVKVTCLVLRFIYWASGLYSTFSWRHQSCQRSNSSCTVTVLQCREVLSAP